MIENIINGIQTRLLAVLPDYTALNFQQNIEKNRATQRKKRFAIVPLGLDSQEGALGTVGRLDITQRFLVILTDVYSGNVVNDTEVIEKMTQLLEDAITAYNSIAPNKISVGGVKIINNLSIEDPDIDEASKQININFTFNVSYFRS